MKLPMQAMIVAVLAVVLADVLPAASQTADNGRRSWNAQWITCPDLPGRAPAVVHFRKVLDLPSKPDHFVVHVSADNAYRLHVNQEYVGSGPSRGDLAHWKYETYDLAPFLRAGTNVIAATVWNFGEHAAAAQISDRLGFVLQSEDRTEPSLTTGENWEVEHEKGVAAVPTPFNVLPNSYYAAEPIERIDGSTFDWSWDFSTPGPRSRWTKARSEGNATLRGSELILNNWQLIADPLPPMEHKLLHPGKIVRATGVAHADQFPEAALRIPPNSHATVLFDNGELTTAYPELTVSGGKGGSIRIVYAEALKDAKGEKGNRNEIAGKEISGIYDDFLLGGEEGRTFSPLVWRTWRYLQLDITTRDQGLDITQFRGWFTAYPFEERAKFSADDPELSAIWSIGWRTARLDAHDTYMDTPYWEQLQYIGDTRIQALLSYTIAGDDRLARQAIAAFDNSRIPDGITLSRYPTSLFQAIPTFSLMWVGMLKDFALYHDDAKFVRENLPGTRATLDWFLTHQNSNGLLAKLPWWAFIDWTDGYPFGVPPQTATGDSSPITLQFIAALRDGAQLETTYGDSARAELYTKAAVRASDAVRRLCWDETLGLIADTPEHQHYSQQANILAVWLDVIPREQQRDVLTRTLSASDLTFKKTDAHVPPMSKASYYFRFYLARALDHVGLADRYLDLIKPWRGMVALGLTTWAEVPEPTRSDSHAWSAHPNYDFLTLVAGIHPSSFGFNSVTIEPHLGVLKRVSAVFPYRQGDIRATYTVSDKNVQAHIELPPALTGTLIWQGREYSLHEGTQDLILNP
jgi:alpha-L-rhamnosidase